jgi:hypothetical protein
LTEKIAACDIPQLNVGAARRKRKRERPEMNRISSKMTFFIKRVYPVMFFGFLLIFPIIFILEWGTGRGPPLMALIVPAFIAAIFYFFAKKMFFNLVDEVWDAGEALVIRNKRMEERIALSEIMNVGYIPFMSPPFITLSLRSPGNFGSKISFCGPVRFLPFSANPIIDDLIERIDAARRTRRA